MDPITFTVLGTPVGQPRARACVRGKSAKTGRPKAGTYNPPEADGWKAGIAAVAEQHKPDAPLTGPLAVTLYLSYPRPARGSNARALPHVDPHTAKPDVDNAAKAVLDALTAAGIWKDDAQVCDLLVSKRYHAEGGRPSAHVRIQDARQDFPGLEA